MDELLNNVLPILRSGLDILLLAFIIYKCYQILVQTKAIQLLKGTIMLILIILVTFLLNLKTLSWLFKYVGPSIIVFLAVIFQPELRKIFTKIGQDKWFRFISRAKKYHFESVINSVEILATQKRGSLIVLARNIGLKNIIETGTRIKAELSTSLILTIFSEDAPLHDGAIIIKEDTIIAAGCFLPLSEQIDIRKSFGTRHRAALGLAEETDAVIIIVSEETGAISLAYDAHLLYDLSIDEVSRQIRLLFEYSEEEETEEVKIED